eukprot:CAMPEP_0202866810 /NCGR_PEP_ID=MMETSP1391-20130828/8372_1 /ASSEMBLY_ACC=CAM_ASM_000867 /TAXON_ID=1034604 /ORGANISM="Chlamydomonas leiostraca, Strain SAG 11-49" /LENGTH=381 /DNA_ID=CAMNT_0049546795 /DNA_START=130 /DNA_END=1272 /DNA_ORIENTATION=-
MIGCLCDLFCCLLPDLPVHTKYAIAKWAYLVGFTLTSVLTWVLRDWASEDFATKIGAVKDFCQDAEDKAACAGGQIAMRISFANFSFFALHALLLLGMTKESDPRIYGHASFWGLKLLLWAGALVGFFFVPTRVIYGYAQFARIASGVFLVMQLVLLINLIYEVNEWLVERDNRGAWCVLVSGSALAFAGGLTIIAFTYHLYAASPSCHLNLFFSSWSIVAGLALLAVLFVPNRAQSAGLLTSGAVFLYCSYLLMSALVSEPATDPKVAECIRGGGTSVRWVQIVAFFIALAAVIYSTLTAGISSRDMFGNKGEPTGLDTPVPYRADFYHAVFALASCYLAMLFSNWEVSPSTKQFEMDMGWISTWVKMGSKWACEILYVW